VARAKSKGSVQSSATIGFEIKLTDRIVALPGRLAANRELITRFEQKIQATLARIWGEDAPSNAPT
jgi:hypothetical protein